MFYDLIFKPSRWQSRSTSRQTYVYMYKAYSTASLYFTSHTFNKYVHTYMFGMCVSTNLLSICLRSYNVLKFQQVCAETEIEFKMFASSILRTFGHCGPFRVVPFDCYFHENILCITLKVRVAVRVVHMKKSISAYTDIL